MFFCNRNVVLCPTELWYFYLDSCAHVCWPVLCTCATCSHIQLQGIYIVNNFDVLRKILCLLRCVNNFLQDLMVTSHNTVPKQHFAEITVWIRQMALPKFGKHAINDWKSQINTCTLDLLHICKGRNYVSSHWWLLTNLFLWLKFKIIELHVDSFLFTHKQDIEF